MAQKSNQAAAGAALPAFLMKLATVSLGCAPLLTQYWARSSFSDEIVTLLQRLIRADFLDELAIARTAAVGHHNAKHRGVLGPDPLHANFYCHKFFKRAQSLARAAPLGKPCFGRKRLLADRANRWFAVADEPAV